MQESQVWEALMTIAFRKLNIVVIIDRNGFQTDLSPNEVKPIHDISKALEGFGYRVITIDGHDLLAIESAWNSCINQSTGHLNEPVVIICDTVKAGGSKLLGDVKSENVWHSKVPPFELYSA